MAINPNTQYPGRVTAPDADYPYGSSKNESSPGAGDGTPYEKARADDIFGFQQAILNEAGIVPSGNADTVNASDYLDGLKVLFGTRHKNIIINGAMDISQRGTSFTAPVSGEYTLDRFNPRIVGTSGVFDILQANDSPTVIESGIHTTKCLHVDVTTADAAVAAGDLVAIRQQIEGLNIAPIGFGQSGTRPITLSFWHKHTKTGVYCVSLLNSALNRSYVAEYSQSISDTWEKTTITLNVDTAGVWLYDNNVGLSVNFTLMAGSTYNGATVDTWEAAGNYATSNQVNALDSVSNNFKITQIQLEEGKFATDFERRSIGEELELCQRYYQESNLPGVWTGDTINGSIYSNAFVFPVAMRSTPSGVVAKAAGENGFNDVTFAINASFTDQNQLAVQATANVTQAASVMSYSWTADSEL